MQLNKDLMNKLYHATQQKEALEKQLEKETPSMFNYCLNSCVIFLVYDSYGIIPSRNSAF